MKHSKLNEPPGSALKVCDGSKSTSTHLDGEAAGLSEEKVLNSTCQLANHVVYFHFTRWWIKTAAAAAAAPGSDSGGRDLATLTV